MNIVFLFTITKMYINNKHYILYICLLSQQGTVIDDEQCSLIVLLFIMTH